MKAKVIIFIALFNITAVFPVSAQRVEVEVRTGDTLHGFADKYLKDPLEWPKIYDMNKTRIKDPNRIFPGQKILIPVEMLKEKVGDLVQLKEDVKVKKRETNRWRRGETEERLFPEDGIMTGEKSYARVDFLVGSRLKVYANSLIYLKPTEKRTAVTSLLGGGLSARSAKVITPSAEVIPAEGASYDINVDEKESTRVSVREGEVDVKAAGEIVTVFKGFRTLVEKGKAPQSPVVLPLDGEEGLQFKGASGITFKLQVSENNNFDGLVKDEVTGVINNDYIKQGLEPGQYYWRVAIIDKDGFSGDFSRARSLHIGGRPEGLVELNGFEVVNKEEGILKISGYSSNLEHITLNGYPADLNSDGTFSVTILLNPGQDVITVTSFGESGVFLRKYLRSDDGLWLPAK